MAKKAKKVKPTAAQKAEQARYDARVARIVARLQLRIPEKELKRMAATARQAAKDAKRIAREADRLFAALDVQGIENVRIDMASRRAIGVLSDIDDMYPGNTMIF